MYCKHPNLPQPESPRQRLWRYLPFEQLLQIINDSSLYFSHISRMRDRWEGLLTERTREHFFKVKYSQYGNSSAANGSIKQYEEFKDAFYVNCWHMNVHESYLMWKVYADRECAIQTTFERITTALHETPAEIHGGMITYIDFKRDSMPIGNVFTPVSHKDIPYQDEKEFRLLFWKSALQNRSISVPDNGISIPIDLSLLIENIFINPTSIQNFNGPLQEAMARKSLHFEIRNSRIKE